MEIFPEDFQSETLVMRVAEVPPFHSLALQIAVLLGLLVAAVAFVWGVAVSLQEGDLLYREGAVRWFLLPAFSGPGMGIATYWLLRALFQPWISVRRVPKAVARDEDALREECGFARDGLVASGRVSLIPPHSPPPS